MKQFAFMVALTVLGGVGALTVAPFCGVAVYYLFAVMRPQYMWKWVLPPDVPWSEYVAIPTIVATIASALGFFSSSGPRPGTTSTPRPKLFTAAHICLLLFGGWIGITYLGALDREASYPWFMEYLKIFVMFAVSTLVIRTVRQIWILFALAALALGYIAYEVNFMYTFQGRYMGIYFNGYGGLDNNGAGLMLAMGVPLCAFVWEGTSRWWRWGFAALIVPLLHAVLLTFSRGAMLGLLMATPLFLVRSRHRRPFSVGMLALVLLLPFLAGAEIRQEFSSIGEYDADSSAQSRLSSWKAGWEMAKDNPIFGTGLRNSTLFSREYGADFEGRVIHSQYLQLAADSGFVGLALYLTGLFAVWRAVARTRRRWKRVDTDQARQVYAIACGVETAMATFCFGAIFLSLEVFELPYLLLLLGAQLAVVQGTVEQPAREAAAARAGRTRQGAVAAVPAPRRLSPQPAVARSVAPAASSLAANRGVRR